MIRAIGVAVLVVSAVLSPLAFPERAHANPPKEPVDGEVLIQLMHGDGDVFSLTETADGVTCVGQTNPLRVGVGEDLAYSEFQASTVFEVRDSRYPDRVLASESLGEGSFTRHDAGLVSCDFEVTFQVPKRPVYKLVVGAAPDQSSRTQLRWWCYREELEYIDFEVNYLGGSRTSFECDVPKRDRRPAQS